MVGGNQACCRFDARIYLRIRVVRRWGAIPLGCVMHVEDGWFVSSSAVSMTTLFNSFHTNTAGLGRVLWHTFPPLPFLFFAPGAPKCFPQRRFSFHRRGRVKQRLTVAAYFRVFYSLASNHGGALWSPRSRLSI